MDTKYLLFNNDFYDYHRIQEKLARYAADGWHLEKITNLYWKFRYGAPETVRYEVIYSAAASAYNSQPTEEEQDLAELCAGAGWELAASYAQIQIYRNPDPNATPLETDEFQKFENIRRNMRRHMIPQQLLTIGLFFVQLLMLGSGLLKDPAATLSSSVSVYAMVILASVILEYAIQLAGSLLWLRRARRAVESGQQLPPNRFYRWFRWVMLGSTLLFVLVIPAVLKPGYGAAILVLGVLVLTASLGTLSLTKRFGASRSVNFWAPALVTMVVILATSSLLSEVFYLAKPEVEYPLTLTQLTGENSDGQLNIGVDSSPLVSYGRYYDFGLHNQIQYHLADVHFAPVYDMVHKEMEQDFLRNQASPGDAPISDELRELIGADYLRRNTTFLEDRWLICWGNRILYLYADWPLTEAQLEVIADTLKP